MKSVMFDCPGKVIKKVAIVLFWVVTCIYVILAFLFGWEEVSWYATTRSVFNPLTFFGLLIGGPISAYISTLFLVGFGELVENSSKLVLTKTTEK